MVDDEILVALISESVNAEHRPRKVAAMVLLEVFRNGQDLDGSVTTDTIQAKDAGSVADEIRALVNKYSLGGPDAPLPRRGD